MRALNKIPILEAFLSLSLILFLGVGCDSGSVGPGNGNGNGGQPDFSSGNINPGESFSHTFEETGTIEYYCDIHTPDMQGKITISTDAESSGQDTVKMENTQFVPSQITVAPNTEVVWVNQDNFAHTVVEGNPSTGGDGDGGY